MIVIFLLPLYNFCISFATISGYFNHKIHTSKSINFIHCTFTKNVKIY